MNLTFTQIKDGLAICRFPIDHPIVPEWLSSSFFSITKTADELSVVIPENLVLATGTLNLDESKVDKTWKGLKVDGPLDFSLIGIMADIATTLANGGVSIFAISTYDTDYILVKEKDFEKAKGLLLKAGHTVL